MLHSRIEGRHGPQRVGELAKLAAGRTSMTKPHEQWHVLPHGELVEIDDGIWTVVGHIRMPLMDLPRRMTVVRLADSRLVVWSAIALDETEMARLEGFGRPAFLI